MNNQTSLAEQQRETGSRNDWNDIVIKEDLWDLTPPAGTKSPPGTLDQWRKLTGAKDWSEAALDGNSLDSQGEIAVITVMHEMLHSIALSDPIREWNQV